MEQEQTQSTQSSPHIYYIIGAVVLVAVIAVGYFLRPQQALSPSSGSTPTTAGAGEEATPTPTKEPITELGCETQYYNPVVGIPGKYYLSVEGVDVMAASSVTCTITAEVDDVVAATETIEATLVSVPERNGKTFKCTTQGLNLTPQVPTKVTAEIKNDLGETAACFRFFNLP